ncbi:alpha/beta hydrolase [Scleromatobacter humisilvae]|uniref:Alpha/beta hydrolase n=1 Tax=Scleromatobacter humisilvae TaxID=2897159 RepID=A0A9X1YGI4_9BURK|nr:alpha/beta fold hydrolase [Scleromatobacter humisilvae]MCK9685628.1 alpha/beta hydrolase [Scleromatobacter humisilvae]
MKSPEPAWQGRPTRLVLFHGLASSPKEFGFLTHPLRRHGVRLHAPELPGYSAGLLADAARWQDWVAAAGRCLDQLEAESPEPYVLGGLCTGAMLALAVAAERPRAGLRGFALLSPLFAYDGWALPWWYALRSLAYATGITGFFSMREREPYGLRNERMRQLIRAQLAAGETSLVGPGAVPLRAVRESERLSARVRTLLPELAHPVQVQHAREDEICRLASVRQAIARVPTGLLSLHVLENSYHMITADNDRHLVADRLSAFLQGLDAAPADSVPFIDDLSSTFDVVEAATAP